MSNITIKQNIIRNVYNAGFIDLDKQYLTVGFNGFIEGAEFLAQMNEFAPNQYKNINQDHIYNFYL